MVKYKVLIAGSREFTDYSFLESKMKEEMIRIVHDCKIFDHTPVIISGGARGVDSLARRFALGNGYLFEEYPADWNLHGKSAGYIRNQLMVEKASEVIVFWDGISRGTQHTINLTKSAGKNIKIVKF